MKENNEQELKDEFMWFSRKLSKLLIPQITHNERTFHYDVARTIIMLVTYNSLINGLPPSKELFHLHSIAGRNDTGGLSSYLKMLVKDGNTDKHFPMLITTLNTGLINDMDFLLELKIPLCWGLVNFLNDF